MSERAFEEKWMLDSPVKVHCPPTPRIEIAGRENRRVQVFDQDRKFMEKWTGAGSPWGLYNVAGIRNSRVQKFAR